MSFALPKPAVSPATVPTPDFAADLARKPDATARPEPQSGERPTFDAMMARHAEQAQHAQASRKAPAKADNDPADKPQVAAPAKDTPKTAAKAATKTTDAADPSQTATDTAAADTSAAKPEDDAAAQTDAAKTADAKAADAIATAASAYGQTDDSTAQVQADLSTQAQAVADPALTAAALAIQVQVQTQAQVQPLSQTQAPSSDADTDAAQLAALAPQAGPKPKAPKSSAPVAPEDVASDAAPADETKDAAKPDDAVFAALLAQAAPAQGQATPVTPAKTGKAVVSATDKPAAALPVELTPKPDLAPKSAQANTVPTTLGDGQSADTTADQGGDQTPPPFPAVADNRDAAQTQAKVQPAQVQLTPQPLTPELAANAQAAPPVQDNAATAQAFSIQTTPADVTGSYSATGAQTASATTLSKVSIETLSALGLQISKKLSDGVTKFAVELHPADLGKVEVSLNIGRDGKTTAHLRFDTPVTASTFSAHEGDLRQQLANAGLKLDDGALSFSSRDGGGSDTSGQAFAQMFQGQEQASHGHAARALKTASEQADQVDADAALDAALADFRNRPANSTLALNLVV